MRDIILTAGIAAIAIVLLCFIGRTSLDRSEIEECTKWGQEAVALQGFYLTQWQSDECKSHNIIINSPIK